MKLIYTLRTTATALALVLSLTASEPGTAQITPLALGHVDQIAFTVTDIPRAEHFYEEQLGLRKLFAQDNLLLFDLGGMRLLIGTSEDGSARPANSGVTLYLRCVDLAQCMDELGKRGVAFGPEPEFVARQPTHDLWLAFFRDPDGNSLALASEAPRGYNPVTRAIRE
jgi:methylmalonyl-CoA/ethylmalonyl-CoA epimerase